MNELNGWQRLGVLATVLYVAGMASYIVVDYRSQQYMVHTYENGSLFVDYTIVPESEQSATMKSMVSRHNTRKAACQGFQAEKKDESEYVRVSLKEAICDSVSSWGPPQFKELNLFSIFLFILVYPASAWLIIYLVYHSIRWVKNGFSHGAS